MRRFLVLLGLALSVGLTAALLSSEKSAEAGVPPLTTSPHGPGAPLSTCSYTLLNFNFSGTGPAEARRPFTTTTGDTFVQYLPAPPVTSTDTSTATLLLNNGFGGNVSGGITGTFTITNLNGLAVTGSTLGNGARGFQINQIVISDPVGTITAVLALNEASFSTTSPYYPRSVGGYLHSTATTGIYAPYRYEGAIAGTMFQFGGAVTFSGGVVGRLYTGATTLNEVFVATRSLPENRRLSFQPTDVIAQFRHADFAVGGTSTMTGYVTPRSQFDGTLIGTLNGVFALDHDTAVVTTGPNAGRGWLTGNLSFVDTGGDALTGPVLADLTNNSVSGYFFQAIGTGVYTDSVLFATLDGNLQNGGTFFSGQINGIYCAASSFTTNTPTGTPTATGTITAMRTAGMTPSATSTSIPSSTPLAPSATPTFCAINFTDVPSDSTFYTYVRCLACRGVMGGYACGGTNSQTGQIEPCDSGNNPYFRPGNLISRGQIAKIVSNAASFSDDPGSQIYEDVAPGSTFYLWVNRLSNRGYMGGYACGTRPDEPCGAQSRPYFRTNANASRGQLSKIVSNTAIFNEPHSDQTFQDVPASEPFYIYIQRLASRNVMGGYACGGTNPESGQTEPCVAPGNMPYFRPGNSVSRGQASKIVANALSPNCSLSSCAGVPTSLDMSITPSNCTPAGTSLGFQGHNFQPLEAAEVYVTGPHGSIFGTSFQLHADNNGDTGVVTFRTAPAGPLGVWRVTMEGVTSRHMALGYFNLTPP